MQGKAHATLKGRVCAYGARERGPRRYVSKVALRHVPGLINPDVACDSQAGVGGGVEPLEEGPRIVKGGRVQVFVEPNGGPVIGVRQRVYGLLEVD